MGVSTNPAPMYRDAMATVSWLSTRLPGTLPVALRALHHAMDLVEQIGLALRGIDRDHHLVGADESLQRLRAVLHLAVECGQLAPAQALHLAERLDAVRRQIGGWQRRLTDVP